MDLSRTTSRDTIPTTAPAPRARRLRSGAALIAALLAAGSAHAETTYEELCQGYYTTAELIMQHRQQGTPMPEMMGYVDGNGVLEAMVGDAYRQPRYSTAEYQRDLVREFANGAYLICLEQRGD